MPQLGASLIIILKTLELSFTIVIFLWYRPQVTSTALTIRLSLDRGAKLKPLLSTSLSELEFQAKPLKNKPIIKKHSESRECNAAPHLWVEKH